MGPVRGIGDADLRRGRCARRHADSFGGLVPAFRTGIGIGAGSRIGWEKRGFRELVAMSMSTFTRRSFIHNASRATMAAEMSKRLPSFVGRYLDVQHGTPAPALRELAAKALDAAKSAGASYADVRFTLHQTWAFDVHNL